MQQILTIVLLILTVLANCAEAQDKAAKRAFDDAVRLARGGEFAAARERFAALENVAAPAKFTAKVAYNVGVCRLRTGDAAGSAPYFERASALDPKYARAFYALGMARAELGDFAAAETAFRRTLALDARDGEAWFDLAFALLGREDFEGALAAFRRAGEFNSRAADYAHNNAGVILALRGDTADARREFETALRISGGTNAEAAANLRKMESSGGLGSFGSGGRFGSLGSSLGRPTP